MWLKERREGWLRGPDLNRRPLGYEMLNGFCTKALIFCLVSRFIIENQGLAQFYAFQLFRLILVCFGAV